MSESRGIADVKPELSMLSMGFAHPKNVIDNKFILDLGTETTEEWIMEKIGVNSRRSVLSNKYIQDTKNQDPSKALENSDETPTDLAVRAAQMALSKAGISADKVGLIICDCCYPSKASPAEAQRIAERLGSKADAHDVLTACPAFALHVDYLMNFKADALPEYILTITTAALTQTVNYCDRTDPAIWGDGAAAALFSARHVGKLKVIHTFFDADPTRHQAVVVDRYKFFKQDGRAVRDFSVRQTVRMLREMENSLQLDWSKDIFIGHQANATMLRQITSNRNIPEENHWHNAEEFGNQASAGAPIVLGQNWDRLKLGQRIVVAVLGAGLSWGACVFEVTN